MNLPQTLAQYLAITRYELLMSWRQRAIPVMTVSLIALPLFFAFFIKNQLSLETDNLFSLLNPENKDLYARSVTGTVQMFAWAAMYLILIIMAPLIMSAIIPKDRELGVREMLDGLPITHATYLNGKLLGAWLAIFSGLVAAMLLVIMSWQAIFKAIYLPAILSLWLVGGSVLIVLNTGLAILLTAGQPTRKRAYAMSVALSFICLFFHILANTGYFEVNQFAWWEFFTPARAPLYLFYVFDNMRNLAGASLGAPIVDSARIWQTTLAGLAELILIWFVACHYVQTR